MDFNYFDIAVVIILSFFSIRGLLRGFVKEVISLVGIVLSIWLAFTYYPMLAAYLDFFQNSAWRNISAYVVIFVLGMFLTNIIIVVLQRILSFSFLTWFDKLLGLCVGLFKGLLICAIIGTVARGFFDNNNMIQSAMTMPYLNMLMEYVQSHIPSDIFNIFSSSNS